MARWGTDWFANRQAKKNRKALQQAKEIVLRELADSGLVGLSESVLSDDPHGETSNQNNAYRRLTSANVEKLNPLDQDKLLRLVRYLYYVNPVGRRLTEIPVDFGYKAKITAGAKAHKDLQKLLEKFWGDPRNNMRDFVGQIVERYNLEGELLLPVSVNPQDGSVHLKFRDPEDIKSLHVWQDDMKFIDRIEMKAVMNISGGPAPAPEFFRVIRYTDDPSATVKVGESATQNAKEVSATGYRIGDAFYFRQCHLITGRGRSPLEPLVDWLDAHDYTFYDQLQNVSLQAAFIWDVIIKGGTKETIKKRAEEIFRDGAPKPGSVKVHNDSEEWKAVAPALQSKTAVDLTTQIRKVVGLGAGRAETWVAASDDVNRNTAQVSDVPSQMHLERQQDAEESILRDILDFVIDQAILHGTLTLDSDDPELREFSIELPKINNANNKTIAEALWALGRGLEKSMTLGIINKATAQELFYAIAEVEPPADLEESLIEEEQKREEKAQKQFEQQSELAKQNQQPPQKPGGPPNAKSPNSKSSSQ